MPLIRSQRNALLERLLNGGLKAADMSLQQEEDARTGRLTATYVTRHARAARAGQRYQPG
jgi:hypothetical protein